MIDIRKLKELVRLMVANDLTELDLRDTEEQVTLRRDGREIQPVHVATTAPTVVAAAPVADVAASSASTTLVADDDAGLVAIECPMVGTFYTASNPDTPPFVTVGSAVDLESVVCIVEAMKIFNEIKAECTGTIAKVCVENGASVEFGQPLFMIKPN